MKDDTKNTIQIFDRFAMEYQRQFMKVDRYSETLDLFCDAVEKINAEILEVGCGPANVTNYLHKKRPDFHIFATDLSLKMLELAKSNNSVAVFEQMDLREIDKIKTKFNGVMSAFCLPYLSKTEMEHFFKSTYLLLNEGGVLYVSTTEGNNDKSGFQKSSSGKGKALYINYYSANEISEALDKYGFEIVTSERKTYQDKQGRKVNEIIVIAKR